ncbi:DMT family transporter [Ornithinimicrobium avium]|uniref:QacE family quaternary ammonium compound efflux SMR transporter n=1 Tax=Ornithinimicrobium avium TaxID=2283195 RepID=A0A345NN14_9MICO|nr:multidrug efflux SMR transporter [Ornithinimicrobium avium]AXH96422.1 QacE family quaternary ammonium compound efflux SMR transporter [Ornithinimicrobium avium]
MGAYGLLAAAIVLEVVGTLALKRSDGFTRLWPSLAVLVFYVLAFVLLSQVLKAGMPVAVAYAIWSATGIVAIALVGAAFLGEHLGAVQVVGIALVVIGVVTLQLATGAPAGAHPRP